MCLHADRREVLPEGRKEASPPPISKGRKKRQGGGVQRAEKFYGGGAEIFHKLSQLS